METAHEMFENRNKIAKTLAGCSVHVVLLIQISLVVKCVVESGRVTSCSGAPFFRKKALVSGIFVEDTGAHVYLKVLNLYLDQMIDQCGVRNVQEMTYDFIHSMLVKILQGWCENMLIQKD